MARFPESLLAAWVRLGGIARVSDVLRSLNEYRGEASAALIAVARELASIDFPCDHTVNRAEASDMASRFLERALGMFPLVRTSEWKLKRLKQAVEILTTAPFTAEQREPLIARALAFAERSEDSAFRTSALALMTQVLALFPGHHVKARDLIHEVDQFSGKLQLDSDCWCARAFLLPALRALEPDRLDAFVQANLGAITAPLYDSSLGGSPIEEFLTYWEPYKRPWAAWVPDLLEKLARLTLDSGRKPLGKLLGALCRMNRTEVALHFLRPDFGSRPDAGSQCALRLCRCFGRTGTCPLR